MPARRIRPSLCWISGWPTWTIFMDDCFDDSAAHATIGELSEVALHTHA
jgi:hypothetical protein